MNVSFKDNTLKVVTNISKETIEKGISDLTARDEKQNALYAVRFNNAGRGGLDTNGLVANAYIDGKAAVVIVLPADATQADVQKAYGEALLAAAKYTDIIAAAAASKAADIEALFVEE